MQIRGSTLAFLLFLAPALPVAAAADNTPTWSNDPGSEVVGEADWATPDALDPRQLRIATGPLGDTYDRIYAVNVLRLIEGYRGFAQRTGGSEENLQLLTMGHAEIGFTQADVFAAEARRRAEVRDLLVLGSLAPECVYLAYRKGSAVSSFEDLRSAVEGRQPSVAIGQPGSGAHGTWRNLAFLDPSLASVETHEIGGALALNQLALGRFDAVLWVTDPRNWEHTNLRIVNRSSELALMPVDTPELELEMDSGIGMYDLRRVTTTPGFFGSGAFGHKLRTLCTSTLVVARSDASPSLVGAVADLVGLHGKWISERQVELR